MQRQQLVTVSPSLCKIWDSTPVLKEKTWVLTHSCRSYKSSWSRPLFLNKTLLNVLSKPLLARLGFLAAQSLWKGEERGLEKKTQHFHGLAAVVSTLSVSLWCNTGGGMNCAYHLILDREVKGKPERNFAGFLWPRKSRKGNTPDCLGKEILQIVFEVFIIIILYRDFVSVVKHAHVYPRYRYTPDIPQRYKRLPWVWPAWAWCK